MGTELYSQQSHCRWPVYLGVAAATALGGLVRFYGADHSLRLDELTTAWVVLAGWADVAARAWLNNHTPAYFYVAKASAALFGYSELGLRLPSLLAGVAVIPLVYFLALRLTRSAAAAVLGAFLVAADSIFIEYAQDARAYSLVQLLAVVQVLLYLRLLDGPTWRARAAFCLCTAVLFYLHYTSAILVLGEAAYLLLLYVRDERRLPYGPAALVVDGLAVAVLCLPLVPHLRYLFAGRTVLQQFMRPVVLEDLLTLYPLDVYVLYPAALALFAGFAYRGKRRDDEPPLLNSAVFLCCLFVIPVAAVWMANRLDVVRLFRVRYTIVCSPVPVLAAALAFTLCRGRAARLTYLLALLLLTQATEGPLRRFRPDGLFSKHYLEDWRGAVGFIRTADPAAAKPVFVRSGLVEADWLAKKDDPALADYCLAPVNSLYPLVGYLLRPLPYSSELGIREADRKLIERQGGAWLLVRGSTAPAEEIARKISAGFGPDAAAFRIGEKKMFRGVVVLELISVEATTGR
jgi:4-amino-4-deoxy-L-arabinose transferase-like glycosyltransferase